MNRIRNGAIAATLVLGSGCFGYVPTEVEQVELGQDIRLDVAPESEGAPASAVQGDALTSARIVVEGTLAGRDADHLFVRVPLRSDRAWGVEAPLEQERRLSMDRILHVEARQLRRTQTVLWTGAIIAAVTIWFISVSDLETDSEGGVFEPPPPPAQEGRIPGARTP